MVSQPHTIGTQSEVHSRNWINLAAIGLLLVVAAFLLIFNLGDYPAPWYDEGSHLHVAKNFALNSVYADRSSEGYRPFGPAIGVGPTVLLPIAAAFKVFGVSIPAARMVMISYGLLALVALYILSRRFLSLPAALLALAVIFLSPGNQFIFNSRTVLGEVPGLFFLAAGLAVWLSPGGARLPRLLLVGILMGLAAITKNQIALFVLPGLLLAWLLDLFWYRQRGWRFFVVPGVIAGVMFGAWLYIVIIRLGGEGGGFSENLATLREASAGAFFLFKMDAIERALRFMVDSGVYAAMAIPVLLYGLLLSLRRDREGQNWGILMCFVLTGMGIFVTSLGWSRYAFTPIVLLGIVLVRLVGDLVRAMRPEWRGIRAMVRGDAPATSALGWILLAGWALIALALPLYNHYHEINTHGRGDAYATADWLNANVPANALIETWEQELAVLTDHNYHYPPQIMLAHSVAQKWLGGKPVSEFYDFRDYVTPDYVVVGTFDKYAEMYDREVLTDEYDLITSVGDYDIYRRKVS